MAASLTLHGVVLETVAHLPRGWQAGEWSLSHAGTGNLRAKLRDAAPGVEAKQPEALAPPPETPQTHEAPDAERTREQPPAAVAASGLDGDDPRSRQPEAEQGRSDAPSAGVLAAVYYPASQLDQRPRSGCASSPRSRPARRWPAAASCCAFMSASRARSKRW